MKKKTGWLLTMGCLGAGAVLLLCSHWMAEGIRRGLTVCVSVMIPSLYPFLILADFVARTQVGRMLERPLGGIARRVYGCPAELAPAILMSWIGGYPAGARVLAGMVERGAISSEDAGLALSFCVNSGPAFLVAVVGTGVFRSVGWGYFLYGCQVAAGVVTGRILCRRPLRVRGSGGSDYLSPAEGFVRAVSSGTSGMLSICGFVVVFSGVSQVLEDAGLLTMWGAWMSQVSGGVLSIGGADCLCRGFLEIGGGCALAQSLPPGQGALVLPFLVSFSSVSVICQLAASFGGDGVDGRVLVGGRVVHGVVTALLATPVLLGRFSVAPAMVSGRPVLAPANGGLLGGLCLMVMCAMLAAAVSGE